MGGDKNKKPENMSEVFCRTQVKLGYLKDDEKAQELLAALDQQQAVLIDQHYSADIGSTIGHLISMDYEAVERFGRDHPDATAGMTLGAYIIMAAANPMGRTVRQWAKPTVPVGQGMTPWFRNGRAGTFVKEYTNALVPQNPGKAQTSWAGLERDHSPTNCTASPWGETAGRV